MMLTCSVCLVLAVVQVGFTTACFSSVTCAQQSLYSESKLIHFWEDIWVKIDTITAEVVPELKLFEEFIRETRVENTAALSAVSYVENPINLFHLAKRLSSVWPYKLDDLYAALERENDENEKAGYVDDDGEDEDGDECWALESNTVPVYHQRPKRRESFKHIEGFIEKSIQAVSGKYWMNERDFNGAQNAVFQTERVYHISIDQLLRGQLIDGVSVKPLTTEDIYLIADFAVNNHLTGQVDAERWARKWVELKNLTNPEESDVTNIVLAKWLNAKGDPYEAHDVILTVKDTYSNKTEIEQLIENFKSQFNRGVCVTHPKLAKLYRIVQTYGELCRATSFVGNQNVEISNTLFCRYEKTSIPYIRSLVEYANWDPVIKIYHKVVSDSEITRVQALGKPFMKTGKVGTKADGGESFERHSDVAWISYHRSPLVTKLMNRIQMITGLSTMIRLPRAGRTLQFHVEQLQLANYGPGGFYEPHYDSPLAYGLGLRSFTTGRTPVFSERLATWMFYLSDVVHGGRTVFTMLNVSVPVTKGSAVFWWNLYRNGQADKRMMHAGCPVLLGSKWVANLWILEEGQMFRRSCATDKDM
ncbi:prolyl 4-hydroxylase subunit alpha-3-like [Tubulanus polymorphus]|uniref:prolyl 4-hydroxylase subunit alpha-3-like n=1 Tax=Tubulanus polymorphus TaxID=672921 RepID=UPI003DA2A597